MRELLDPGWVAVRWETPPITRANIDRPFEFVILDSPELDRPPDPSAFGRSLETGTGSIAVFPNLRHDALLVAPRQTTSTSGSGHGGVAPFAHLAAFLRNAEDDQRHQLWIELARAVQRRLDERPVWISTAGGGVPWLHVRLDDSPKYYRFERFKH